MLTPSHGDKYSLHSLHTDTLSFCLQGIQVDLSDVNEKE